MINRLCKGILYGSILATLAAGGFTPPAAGARGTAKGSQQTSAAPAKSGTSSGASPAKTAARSARSVKSSSRSKTKKSKGQAAPSPERINEIQDALARNGVYSGDSSGKWDDATVNATKKFQATHGLNPTGKLDAPTLQKLGLGSEIAGMAAPTPPPNSAANRLLSPAARRDDAKENPEDQ